MNQVAVGVDLWEMSTCQVMQFSWFPPSSLKYMTCPLNNRPRVRFIFFETESATRSATNLVFHLNFRFIQLRVAETIQMIPALSIRGNLWCHYYEKIEGSLLRNGTQNGTQKKLTLSSIYYLSFCFVFLLLSVCLLFQWLFRCFL